MQVYIDLKEVASGSLYEDWDMLPPKKIKVSILPTCIPSQPCRLSVEQQILDVSKHVHASRVLLHLIW